ncbi:uncharacterized protein LOC131313297 isoform X2 [Rhododendron vialii]|uniref:uncharacterized protein LOC131313297 isoform X2 n=2 Tax=Rhododendron vialii TaxID=182163 RepID=UPI00265E957A|nr:uncharacterized protein LOC131313297 isoform X2 [Rhododendron vialii]
MLHLPGFRKIRLNWKLSLKNNHKPMSLICCPKNMFLSVCLGSDRFFLKEYGSPKNTPSSFKQLQAPDSEVIILQHQVDEQAKALAELSKTLTKHTRTMAVLQDIVRVLAVKAAVDPTDIVELIEMSNNEEGSSNKRRDAASIGLSKD